jgi:hypothetical protein
MSRTVWSLREPASATQEDRVAEVAELRLAAEQSQALLAGETAVLELVRNSFEFLDERCHVDD